MTDLIVVPQAAHWQRLKRLVLDSVSSPITRRVYNLGLDEFFEWYGREPRPGFNKAAVAAWRVALEARRLGAVSINVRLLSHTPEATARQPLMREDVSGSWRGTGADPTVAWPRIGPDDRAVSRHKAGSRARSERRNQN
jgi:hypothetical protein